MAARSRVLARLFALGAVSSVVLSASLSVGCTLDNAGVDPPAATLNFPTAMALVPGASGQARYLLVANSNYTIRYNTGTLAAFDLDLIHTNLALCTPGAPCTLGTEDDPAGPPESGAPLERYVVSEVGIGSHTSDLVLAPRGAGYRIYAGVRGERSLSFVDLDAATGALECEQQGRFQGDPVPRCGEAYRTGDDRIASARRIELRGDPVAVGSGSLESLGAPAGSGNFVLMALRGGQIALFLDDVTPGEGVDPPQLVHIAEGFPDQLVAIEIQESTGLAWAASTTSRELARAGVLLDGERSFVYDAGRRRLGAVDDGADLRALRFHPSLPNRLLALTRRPEAIAALDLDRSGLTPSDVGLWRSFEVGAGPSKLELATIDGRTYAFATCFDARKVFVIDVDAGELVAVAGGFSGPFALAVDPARVGLADPTRRGWLYVLDFSTSVLRVIDLSRLGSRDELEITATVGPVRPATQFGR
ncbi:MAG: hypothetical protein IT378_22770 [Sandaracinaceae bacterium]|nr:hypothetical protein [Sandaracinaceae bacterium]